ncbi:sortase-dependent protein [Streptacidiphilus sp. PAMC 29251]
MVRTIGVASAAAALSLGVAGNAFACNITDFTATVSCNTSDYTATVKVHDKDSSYAVLTLQKNGVDVPSVKPIGISGGGDRSDTATFTGITWSEVTSYDVHIVVDGQLNTTLAFPAGSGDCSKPTTPPTKTPPTTAPPTTKPPTTPPATTPAPTPTTSSTVDATASPSPTGPVLATTGGGSDSGLIAGLAGAFVIVGAGAVFALRRRSSGTHS